MLVTFALCVAMFTGYSAAFNGQVQIAQQAKLYGKTTVEITYFASHRPPLSLSAKKHC